ncbi:hypothetical protein M911_10125 [Ectothiorhodospira haloalkaliphila]|uniref:Uncharacterized protein n=1 Tax=Ectothiorhodospira haloalkaliphila TaxID=421628 RepID=W8KUP2_9GAMM|nr:hypothetical protein M911_10125 [Ectothiorhodospira haloalkaliphila]
MDQHPGLRPITGLDLDQLVRMAQATVGIRRDLLQFLVHGGISPRPVHPGMDCREQQLGEFLEIGFQSLLPRAVMIRGPGGVLIGHRRKVGVL